MRHVDQDGSAENIRAVLREGILYITLPNKAVEEFKVRDNSRIWIAETLGEEICSSADMPVYGYTCKITLALRSAYQDQQDSENERKAKFRVYNP